MSAKTSYDTFVGTESPIATGWISPLAGKFEEVGGVAAPIAYNVDSAMIADRTFTGGSRFEITMEYDDVTAKVFSPFELVVGLQTKSDLTTDHVRIRIEQGSVSAPYWNSPDLISAIVRLSGVETTITPTNTANNGNYLDYPAIVGDYVSLRHERVVSGHRWEASLVKDQLILRRDDFIVYHEQVPGWTATGGFSGLINRSGSGDNTYDDASVGDLHAWWFADTGDDTTGSGTYASPYKSFIKALQIQQPGEMAFFKSGTWSEACFSYNATGMRLATSFADPMIFIAEAGATVLNSRNGSIFHSKYAEVPTKMKYWYFYNIFVNSNGSTGVNPAVKIWAQSYPFIWQGGGITGCYDQGLHVPAFGTDFNGGNKIYDAHIHGNGRNTFRQHNVYMFTQNNIIAYCHIDGTSSGNGVTRGYGLHLFYSATAGLALDGTQVLFNRVNDHSNTGNVVAGILITRGALVVFGNRVYNNANGIAAGYGSAGSLIARNLSYANTFRGIVLGGLVAVSATEVYFNTVYDNGQYGLWNQSNASGTIVKNNVFYSNGTADILDQAGDITDSNNWKTSDGDPLFVNPQVVGNQGASDFHLQAGSSVNSGGADLTAAFAAFGLGIYDRAGYAQEASPARGAYRIPNPPDVAPTIVMQDTATGFTGQTVAIAVAIDDDDGDLAEVLIEASGNMTVQALTSGGGVTVEGGD